MSIETTPRSEGGVSDWGNFHEEFTVRLEDTDLHVWVYYRQVDPDWMLYTTVDDSGTVINRELIQII